MIFRQLSLCTMPPYELALILRAAPKAELKEIVKRALQTIKQHGGLVGQLDNLGEQRLPYRMKKHGERFDRGFYMFAEADLPAQNCKTLTTALMQDRDVIRPTLLRKEVENPRPCSQGECFFGELTNTEHKMAIKWGRFTKVPA